MIYSNNQNGCAYIRVCVCSHARTHTAFNTTLNSVKNISWCTKCTFEQDADCLWTHAVVVLCPNSPSASSNTRMASCCLASWKMASMFLVLSPTHLLSSSPQFTTYGQGGAARSGRGSKEGEGWQGEGRGSKEM